MSYLLPSPLPIDPITHIVISHIFPDLFSIWLIASGNRKKSDEASHAHRFAPARTWIMPPNEPSRNKMCLHYTCATFVMLAIKHD